MLFMDETILTSTPPLRAKWVLQGTQALVPIIGDHKKRILYGTPESEVPTSRHTNLIEHH
jgi:hypothetical protein